MGLATLGLPVDIFQGDKFSFRMVCAQIYKLFWKLSLPKNKSGTGIIIRHRVPEMLICTVLITSVMPHS